MDRFCIIQSNETNLDLIRSLWEKLNQLHFNLSPHFKNRFQNMNWEKRKSQLLKKSSIVLLEYIIDNDINEIVGYCISTIDREDNKIGEIDSIYVEENYRESGLGKQLVNRSIEWLKSKNTETQILSVAIGNEKVLEFYKHFDFYPLHINLQKIDRK